MADQAQKQYNSLVNIINKNQNSLNKHDHIRLKHWLEKLAEPVTNSVWKQNRNLYLKILLQMILKGELLKPFNSVPPEGPLPKITVYDVPYPIRVKIIENENLRDRRTPSHHKTSYHSRRNSSTINNENDKRSFSKENKKMEHKKKIIFDPTFQTQIDDNKENLSEYLKSFKSKSINMDESLFAIKDKNISKENTQKITFKSNQVQGQTRRSSKNISKGSNILKKALKFLGKHYNQFENSITYSQLIEKIVQTGDSIGQDFRNVTVPDMQQSIHIDRYNQRIKHKLFQTDLNTLQFMSYLNSLV